MPVFEENFSKIVRSLLLDVDVVNPPISLQLFFTNVIGSTLISWNK
jgi:hypothetical protein